MLAESVAVHGAHSYFVALHRGYHAGRIVVVGGFARQARPRITFGPIRQSVPEHLQAVPIKNDAHSERDDHDRGRSNDAERVNPVA